MRRASAAVAAALLGATLGGCALLAPGGTTEMQIADRTAFSTAHTYRIVADPGAAAPLRDAVERNIESTLGSKGYQRVAADSVADLRVEYRTGNISRVQRDAQPEPPVSGLTTVGGTGAATGYEPIAGSAVTASVGRLVLYVNDERAQRVVWQGTQEAEAVGAGMARSTAGRAAARLLRDVPPAPRP